MKRKESFEERAAELKARLTKTTSTHRIGVSDSFVSVIQTDKKWNLKAAADELGVSRSTARRLFMNEPGVRRYSTTTTGKNIIYPGKALKRFQRVRLTYIIPDLVLMSVKRRLSILLET